MKKYIVIGLLFIFGAFILGMVDILNRNGYIEYIFNQKKHKFKNISITIKGYRGHYIYDMKNQKAIFSNICLRHMDIILDLPFSQQDRKEVDSLFSLFIDMDIKRDTITFRVDYAPRYLMPFVLSWGGIVGEDYDMYEIEINGKKKIFFEYETSPRFYNENYILFKKFITFRDAYFNIIDRKISLKNKNKHSKQKYSLYSPMATIEDSLQKRMDCHKHSDAIIVY